MISAPGLGTGLDIAGIVDTLVAAERAPQDNRLNESKSRATARCLRTASSKAHCRICAVR